jgi:hypothetical protein
MKGRVRRIEKKLAENMERRIAVVEEEQDPETGQTRYLVTIIGMDETLEFSTKGEVERYFEKQAQRHSYQYHVLFIVSVGQKNESNEACDE